MKWIGAAVVAAMACAVVFFEPWVSASPLSYESVSGWPMRIYFRNGASYSVRVTRAGGMPALVTEKPLTEDQIDAFMATVAKEAKPDNDPVRGGDFVRFNIEDPEGLAWKPDKMEETSWFYVFARLESDRPFSLFWHKWVREVCLVSQTHEPFRFCPTHNEVYAE